MIITVGQLLDELSGIPGGCEVWVGSKRDYIGEALTITKMYPADDCGCLYEKDFFYIAKQPVKGDVLTVSDLLSELDDSPRWYKVRLVLAWCVGGAKRASVFYPEHVVLAEHNRVDVFNYCEDQRRVGSVHSCN